MKQSDFGHRDDVEEVVERCEQLKAGDMNRILLSDMAERGNAGANKRSSKVEMTLFGELPSKSVIIDIASGINVHQLSGRGLLVVANVGDSFLSAPQFDGRYYCTSDLVSIAR